MPSNSPPAPVVIFIHGGGWVQGTKEGSILQGVLPYVAIATTYLYFDLRVAKQDQTTAEELGDVLPEEVPAVAS